MKVFGRSLRSWGGLTVLLLALAATCATAAEPEIEPEVEPPTQGMLEAETPDGEKVPCPLKHTSVRADISGYLANVEVRQHFQNPFDEKIEAVYTFPLPQNSAVDEMIMVVGRRDIYGEIHERERARVIYEQARAAGKRTALLEQERPNIFTQSVANIQPHEEIIIVIRYAQPLKYDNGRYNYHFPMVVGPRFIPGSPTDQASTGTGWSPDTDTVPDASRITPPVLKPGHRTGHDISLEVYLDAGMPIEDLRCRSHDASIHKLDGTAHYIKLKDADSIPNKDFMLSYRVAGEEPRFALLTHKSQGGGYFMLMFQPSLQNVTTEYHPKEMYFVLDCSGSMRGEPMAKSKQAMVSCIRGIGPRDTFQIIRFSSSASQFSEDPVPSTQENKRKALEYVDGLRGTGGTRMIEGIKAALGGNRDPERRRVVFFFTDGYIGNENQIFNAIKEKVGDARIYSFGVGSSVNRHLIEGMAKLGGGVAHTVRQDEDPSQVITGLYSRLEKPYLKDIHLDVDGVRISDTYPDPVPDLLQAQPLIVFGKYEGSGWSTVTVTGELRGEYYRESLNVSFPQWNSDNVSLPSAWARHKIQQMMFEQLGRPKDLSGEITDLALEYHLMSQYTSFVAVDEQIPPGSDSTLPRTVAVPVPMPEGVSFHGVFGAPGRYPGATVGEVAGERVKMEAFGAVAPPMEEAQKQQTFLRSGARSQKGMPAGNRYQRGGSWGAGGYSSPAAPGGYAAGYGGGGYGGRLSENRVKKSAGVSSPGRSRGVAPAGGYGGGYGGGPASATNRALPLSRDKKKEASRADRREPPVAQEEEVKLDAELPEPMFQGTPANFDTDNLDPKTGEPRGDVYVPGGTRLVSKGKPVSSSYPNPIIGDLQQITDGEKAGHEGTYTTLGPGKQWVQIDLKKNHEIQGILLWHYHSQARVYHDVVVQVSTDKDFQNAKTVFNNDHDNSSGLGIGDNYEYVETNEGKWIDVNGVTGRYVRAYSKGNTANEMNHYTELAVYARPVFWESDARTRILTAAKVARSENPGPEKVILKLLDDKDPTVKALAARAARRAEKPTRYADELAEIVNEADPEEYAGAVLESAIGLAGMADAESVRAKARAALLVALGRKYPDKFGPGIRIAALKGLEGYKGPDGLEIFRNLMKEAANPDVRALACQRALAYPEAVPEIRKTAFSDEAFASRPELLASVVQSARRRGKGKELAQWAQEKLQSGRYGSREHGLVRVALVECMLDEPTRERVKYARSLLRTDRSWRVRRAVLARLASRGGMHLRLAADLALEDPHPLVKRLATAALVASKARGETHEKYLKRLSEQPTLATCESIFAAEDVSPDLALKRADAIRKSLKG